ncbi:protein containing domain of unknown function (DUF350) [Rubidibacter lacunae KORDI 51-2]|uniref:DUF350 domain-containing protein n=2 Tax=Rubidibacter TaxID=582491 RepID=U5DG57_9CHRO|nr:protein containing domain of unknown function (DUF350) [Rubidibacter lacunae KORDI 51-2]
MLDVLARVAATIGWTAVGVVLLYGGVRLYDYLDPIDYSAEIRKGNLAAGLKLSALVLGLTAIIIAVLIT